MTVDLRYAVSVPNYGEFADVRAVAQLAREAEAAGWDGFFTWDHILLDANAGVPMSDPWVALTAIALATERMRIGTLITPLARRRPWVVARQTVTIDHLSNGRMILGVGLGFPPEAEFAALGEDADDGVRAEKLDEALDIITGLWRGEAFSHAGKHYSIDGATFLPRPVQQPRIPIWVAGVWPNCGPLRRAARWDGVVPLKVGAAGIETLTQPDLAEIVRYVHEHRTNDGPFDVVCGGPPPDDDPARLPDLIASFREAGLTWWLGSTGGEPGSFADLRARVRAGPVR
ncbi:MAG: LLM class flavin-dependent oxidoreductase [Dehalococcoidia bacterium]